MQLYGWSVHQSPSPMKQINVTALRQNLSRYLAWVARGERISVTHRGRVIAEIVPPTPAGDAAAARARLRSSLISYDAPFDPVIPADAWEMNR